VFLIGGSRHDVCLIIQIRILLVVNFFTDLINFKKIRFNFREVLELFSFLFIELTYLFFTIIENIFEFIGKIVFSS